MDVASTAPEAPIGAMAPVPKVSSQPSARFTRLPAMQTTIGVTGRLIPSKKLLVAM